MNIQSYGHMTDFCVILKAGHGDHFAEKYYFYILILQLMSYVYEMLKYMTGNSFVYK